MNIEQEIENLFYNIHFAETHPPRQKEVREEAVE